MRKKIWTYNFKNNCTSAMYSIKSYKLTSKYIIRILNKIWLFIRLANIKIIDKTNFRGDVGNMIPYKIGYSVHCCNFWGHNTVSTYI